jgi:hypothetical protein
MAEERELSACDSLVRSFEEDLRIEMHRRLSEAGYSDIPPGFVDTALCYHNATARRITARPRRFLTADTFACPRHLQIGLDALAERIRVGKSLLPNQSRFALSTHFQDKLLNHWGIHHFHLGITHDDGFQVGRTSELLFAAVTNDAVLGIAIGNHEDWYEHELLEILHRNWPESLVHRKLEGIEGGSQLAARQIAALRSKNANCAIAMSDGTVYAAPFGGVVASGHNIQAIHWVGLLNHGLRSIAELCLEHLRGESGCPKLRLEFVDGHGIVQIAPKVVLRSNEPIIPEF